MVKDVDETNPKEGGVVTFTITVTNDGPNDATGVEFQENLPPGVTYLSHNAPVGTFYDPTTGLFIVGELAAKTSVELEITVEVDEGTAGEVIINAGSALADQADIYLENNTGQISFTVQEADLIVDKNVDESSPKEGGTVVYTITVTNKGPNEANDVEITDTLPEGLTYVSNTTSQGSYDEGTGVWTVGTLAKDQTETLTITATVNGDTAGDMITNMATVTNSDQGDSDPINSMAPGFLFVLRCCYISARTHEFRCHEGSRRR